jgi:exopolysaccharide biosynthesis polyprenyl glycosylphosphotransferase
LLEIMLRSEPELGYRVTGVVGDCADDGCWNSLPTSPSIGSIPSLAAATGATGVLIVPYALSSAATQHAIAIAAGASLHVQVWPGWRGVGNQRLRQTPISDVPFFYVEPRPSTRWQPAVKRILDVSGAIVGLCLAAPFIFVAALLIKLEDRGPVLHRGERVGLHGQTFFVYKLRSMTPNNGLTPPDLATLNERVDGPLFKVSNDPRTTRVGRILRASSFDELPQLWNVLQGTMSLVGPRPALPSEVAQFDEELQRRHGVRPGMTGLWQVEARNNPSFNAYRRLDLRYVDNWSLWLDLTILVSTVPSVTSQAVAGLRRSLQH